MLKINRIKTIGLSSLLLLVAAFLVSSQSLAQNTQNFKIESFTADYYISKDDKQVSQMRVEEKIVAVFPDFDQNHGILRAIPETYNDKSLGLSISGVTNNAGQNINYTTDNDGGNLVLKIGDADKYVRGKQIYNISYNVKNFITFEDDYDEMYWDVNGDQWQQPFTKVTANVHLPDDIASQLMSKTRCFSGLYGSNSENCVSSQSSDGTGKVLTFNAVNLSANETLTFVIGFNKGTFLPDKRAELLALLIFIAIVAGIVLPPIITFLVVVTKWRSRGRDPKGRGTIIVQYSAPKEINVVLADIILNEKMNNKAITATVIELAIKGYVVIHETTKKKILKDKKEYELELIKLPDDLSQEQKKVCEIFFGTSYAIGAKVKPSDLSKNIYKEVQQLGTDASKAVTEQGYFTFDPRKAGKSLMTAGVILLTLGFFLLFTGVGTPFGIGLLLSCVITFVGASKMPARTLKGVDMRDYLLGVREYIKMAEVDRLAFSQSVAGAERIMSGPKAKIKLFEDLLPYAMLLGLEESWAKEFQDIYQQPPDWYRGNFNTFNTVYLANSIGSFGSASASSFSPPSSSGSSGFSGGGGYSGGGGGGGGGGGW